MQVIGRIFIAAVHAAVAVVVYRAVSNVVLVHQVHNVHDGLRVVGGIAVNLHIEDVSTACEGMVGSFNLGFVLGAALVVHWHMVAVGVVNLVGDSWNFAKVLTVAACELAGKSLGWCGEHAVVVLVFQAELVDAFTHVAYNLQAKFLALLALAMMLPCECDEALGKTNEPNAKRTLVYHAFYGFVGLEVLASVPQLGHEQWELLGHRGFLEVEAVIELTGSDVEHIVELMEEFLDACLLVFNFHALDGKTHNVDG